MLDSIKDRYYQGWGNYLEAMQDLKAKSGFIPDRETSYVSQMGMTPFSIKSHKYMGDNLSTLIPGIASKPGRSNLETQSNYINDLGKQKPGTNRVLVRTHTHPTSIGNMDISDIPKVPSPQDFVNAAHAYSLPQNKKVRYMRNKIYTKEGGKDVRYTYDISDDVKRRIDQGGDAEVMRYYGTETLSGLGENFKAMAGAGVDSLRGKGSFNDLANRYLNENILKKYQKMGYPISREEF